MMADGNSGRLIAVSDIHGCTVALDTLLSAVTPSRDDTLVTLGDYVDRGPDCRGAFERLLALEDQCRLVALLGNHDVLFRGVAAGRRDWLDTWLALGGRAALESFGGDLARLPPRYLDFLDRAVASHESERHFFVHANYLPNLPLDEQPAFTLRWEPLRLRRPGPHCSGKTAIVGHTAQKDGRVLDLGHLVCIDTCCYGGGWLTALEVRTGQLWHANQRGQLRTAWRQPPPDTR